MSTVNSTSSCSKKEYRTLASQDNKATAYENLVNGCLLCLLHNLNTTDSTISQNCCNGQLQLYSSADVVRDQAFMTSSLEEGSLKNCHVFLDSIVLSIGVTKLVVFWRGHKCMTI